jgi:hypothetical protein
MLLQRVCLLASRFAVVAGDQRIDVGGQQAAVERVDLGLEGAAQHRRVGAGPLRDGHGDHRLQRLAGDAVEGVVVDLLGAVDHLGHVGDLD